MCWIIKHNLRIKNTYGYVHKYICTNEVETSSLKDSVFRLIVIVGNL